MSEIWNRLKNEPALVINLVVGILAAVVATLPHAPDWLQVVLAVVVALGGALGIRAKVTPV